MKIYHHLAEVPTNLKAYITIGKFDGLHAGHLEVLKKLVALAREGGAEALLITFKNNPFIKNKENHQINHLEKRFFILEKQGIDSVLEISLNEISKTSYFDFLSQIVEQFNCLGIVASDKLAVGFQKQGDYQKIKSFFEEKKKMAFFFPSLKLNENCELSSTEIRNFIKRGKIREANQFLFLPFSIKGKVIKGKQLGKTIDFPTINLAYPRELIKIHSGSYATVTVLKNKMHRSMSFVGHAYKRKPLAANFAIETYIFDFNAIIYGEEVEVFFLSFLGSKVSLPNTRALKRVLLHYKSESIDFFNENESLVESIAAKLILK